MALSALEQTSEGETSAPSRERKYLYQLSIPRYEWEKQLPYMQKCDMCFDRLRKGQLPACVEVCPQKACIYGERSALLREAKRRIARSPKKYIQHVYGEEELGGTSIIYISDMTLDVLGWPKNVGTRTMRSYTWPIISKTPWVAATVGSLLVGTYAVIQRRMRLQAMNGKNHAPEHVEASDIEKGESGEDR